MFNCEVCEDTGIIPNSGGCGDACGGWADYCYECDINRSPSKAPSLENSAINCRFHEEG